MKYQSILVIGATGRTGTHLINQIQKQHHYYLSSDSASTTTRITTASTNNDKRTPQIFALCRDPSKLTSDIKSAGTTNTIQGNARDQQDIQKALDVAKPDLIVISIGNGDSVKKNDIRTTNAKALVSVLTNNIHTNHDSMKCRNIPRVMVVSSIGAGSSKIKVGFGIGSLIAFHLRHVLKDHTGQEAAFLSSPTMKERTLILHPTALTENKMSGKVVTFGDEEKCPSLETDRGDLVNWMLTEVIFDVDGGVKHFGKHVNLASKQ